MKILYRASQWYVNCTQGWRRQLGEGYICQESSGKERNKILGLITSAVKFCVKSNLGVALMRSVGNLWNLLKFFVLQKKI